MNLDKKQFEKLCDAMRCADILTPESTYGDIAMFIISWLDNNVESDSRYIFTGEMSMDKGPVLIDMKTGKTVYGGR